MPTRTVDYSLYLVTSRALLPPGQDYLESLEASLQGGVTLVQVREKDAGTKEFLDIARKSKDLCARYGVPLIVNDRVDIALAIEADGVHVGQEDMPIQIVRSILPPGSIIGVSCNNVEQARQAVESGADYIGIGAIYPTATKELTQPIVTVRGVGAILSQLDGSNVKAVAIGGINSTTVLRVLHGAVSTSCRALDGVAVVSDIVASDRPEEAAGRLMQVLRAFREGTSSRCGLALENRPPTDTRKTLLIDQIASLLETVRSRKPLVHQITNVVAATQSANVTLAWGASPIMATAPEEMPDLANVCDSLLVNIGTLRQTEGMLIAGRRYNATYKPVVFDPVGVGASQYRKGVMNDLLNAWAPTVIKGNAGELAVLAGSDEAKSRGVDSFGAGFKDPASFVRSLARKERCVIALTGPKDYVSDGDVVVELSNGHPLLGEITGSGCIGGSSIAAFCAAASTDPGPVPGRPVCGDMLLATVAAITSLNVAGELAAARADVAGPGSFLPALIDEISLLRPDVLKSRLRLDFI
ncbi:Hydroxyethylthiazole kinase [Pterulicium gracile]|uniref:Hydroxyethylthiazole kinase n=1 Tax=Pterulicium gracile TaxID=1884261 RepID=A0A5C3QWX1_9AGAR|nr:Hydroxyethylthiazole kinase [Pterula gracilis]